MQIGLDPLLTKSPLPAIVHFFGVIWLLGEAKKNVVARSSAEPEYIGQWPGSLLNFIA